LVIEHRAKSLKKNLKWNKYPKPTGFQKKSLKSFSLLKILLIFTSPGYNPNFQLPQLGLKGRLFPGAV
jgi:hypothetical protein